MKQRRGWGSVKQRGVQWAAAQRLAVWWGALEPQWVARQVKPQQWGALQSMAAHWAGVDISPKKKKTRKLLAKAAKARAKRK